MKGALTLICFSGQPINSLQSEGGDRFAKCSASKSGVVNAALDSFQRHSTTPLHPTCAFVDNNHPAEGALYFPMVSRTPSECAANSGAYIHWMVVMPLEKSPLWAARSGYSNT